MTWFAIRGHERTGCVEADASDVAGDEGVGAEPRVLPGVWDDDRGALRKHRDAQGVVAVAYRGFHPHRRDLMLEPIVDDVDHGGWDPAEQGGQAHKPLEVRAGW